MASGCAAAPLVLGLSACIWTPNSRIAVEKQNTLTVSGYALEPSASVSVSARNNNSGTFTVFTSTSASATETIAGSGLYYWSKTINTSSNSLWTPTGLGTISTTWSPPGRLEVTALIDGNQAVTFTEEAEACTYDHINNGDTYIEAGQACQDGDALVLFENSGVATPVDSNTLTPVDSRNYNGVHYDYFSYVSQGLDIYAVVCTPLVGVGPFPLHVVNHGATGGMTNADMEFWCDAFAGSGWMVAMSSYRGEPMTLPDDSVHVSEGVVEYCLGEVTDVLRLLDVVDANYNDADMDKVLMTGASHGGCITTRAVERGAPVKAAVDMYGPSDWGSWYDACVLSGTCGLFLTELDGIIGAPPSTAPMAYHWRSPAYHDAHSDVFAGDLRARTDVKFMIMHGLDDTLVLPEQSCDLARYAWAENYERWHVDTDGSSLTTAASGCVQTSWNSTSRASNPWDAQRYLFVYEGTSHAPNAHMWTDYLSFIISLGF
ncbi:MAG: prolyl oligopeptidase family serine peptidase [Nannocystaceae bacterium]